MGGLDGLHKPSGVSGEQKNILALLGFEHGILQYAA